MRSTEEKLVEKLTELKNAEAILDMLENKRIDDDKVLSTEQLQMIEEIIQEYKNYDNFVGEFGIKSLKNEHWEEVNEARHKFNLPKLDKQAIQKAHHFEEEEWSDEDDEDYDEKDEEESEEEESEDEEKGADPLSFLDTIGIQVNGKDLE